MAGIVLIILAGSALHFAFEWADYWRPAALIAAANESTWEHLKLGFWPGLMFALVEYPFIRKSVNNFWVAKALGLLAMPTVIVVLFYGYTVLAGQNYLLADIMTFILAVIIGQLVSYRFLVTGEIRPAIQRHGPIGLAVMAVAFSLLTYYPPRFFLFEDPRTNEYGTLEYYDELGASHLEFVGSRG
ncbi:MAG TPA: DUF6512 family protein [Anaerolineae bacterium]|nr:DUF6512 family protein [Anaerolineae bacterium]